ncbi:uncharacterized protein (DUF427 family) [Luteibacter jiangsuensis]|uniref:Uncharacterized protein (DUF427 family) n=1 Tax=Luteibacter jiangsuensis TaxID=637577 RepID=A0ABT9SV71_9GAMM|nr:DUF427 domain-containing protein [Luteibacter jiangsuensis]MDQ0007882.1 uncharacterized protein (DUF427 family) [Luteibacter jiangsuensis]
MSSHPVKIPGPDHPITVEQAGGRVVVHDGDRVVADTRDALVLKEGRYPAVFYIPRADADMASLRRTEHHTYCPYKGEASYYSLPGNEERAINAIWTYEEPHEAVSSIRGHLAFYPDRVRIEHTSG